MKALFANSLDMLQRFGALAALAAVLVLPELASAQTLGEFNTALDSAVGTTTSMISSVGGKGVVILLATLAIAIVVVFVRAGFAQGLKAMKGKH